MVFNTFDRKTNYIKHSAFFLVQLLHRNEGLPKDICDLISWIVCLCSHSAIEKLNSQSFYDIFRF